MFYLDQLAKKRKSEMLKKNTEKISNDEYGKVKANKKFLPQKSIPAIPTTMTFTEWQAHEYKVLKPRLKKIKIKLDNKVNDSSCIDVYLSKKLNKLYQRDNLCLKVFKRSKSVWGFDHSSNPSSIISSTIAQNLLWLKGQAPRIYDLVEINGLTAQVSEYIGGKFSMPEIHDDRLVVDKRVSSGKENFVGGKFVDLEGTYLKDYAGYRGYLLREIAKTNEANGHCKGMYQSVYNTSGIRNTDERVMAYGFKDFTGQKVLDIGCSNGMLCRSARDLGAVRVVGLEHPNMAKLAQLLAFMDGYFDIDFYGVDLKNFSQKQLIETTGITRFNTHFFFAMENHVGWPEYTKNCDTLYYEGHGQPRPFKVVNLRDNPNIKISPISK